MRHGVAEERGSRWPEDAKRPLTREGIARFRKSVAGLASLEVALDVIITSPLVRTKQTAEILADGLSPKPSIVNLESLTPGGSAVAVIADLGRYAKAKRLAIVGHEPGIGELAARLMGSRHAMSFKKGGMCRIDVEELPPTGPGELRWFLTPRILRRLHA